MRIFADSLEHADRLIEQADSIKLPPDIAAALPVVQMRYVAMLNAGQTERFAEMAALRKPPRATSDRELFSGLGTLGDQLGEEQASLVTQEAAKRGYTANRNDVYMPALADFVGDPCAFVPPTGGRGHIKKVQEARGKETRGLVKTKARPSEHEDIPLADDIVKQLTPKVLANDPKLAKATPKEIHAEVVRRHGPKTG